MLVLTERKLSSRVDVFLFFFFWERIYDSTHQSTRALHSDVGQSIKKSINAYLSRMTCAQHSARGTNTSKN